MQLKVTHQNVRRHTATVTGLGWAPKNELITVGDDQLVQKWNLDGAPVDKVMDLESKLYVTSFHWAPSVGHTQSKHFAIGCSDGKFRIINISGKIEKVKEAHGGAVTAIGWNSDGTALATGGEDGALKQWSKTGHLRSNLVQNDRAVYSLCWSPDDSAILFCSGKSITIKPIQVSKKPTIWRAHNGTVLTVGWNSVNGLIISGGEDCRYKVWDSYGRQLYVSKAQEYPISALSWEPSGEYFAFGSFDLIALCDKTGWIHSRASCNTGSITHLDWTDDGNHLAGAGSNGQVAFGAIVARRLQWRNHTALLNESNQIIVSDCLNEDAPGEQLEFGHRVIDMAMCHNHLIVATEQICYVYTTHNIKLSTPQQFDIKGVVNLIIQSDTHFMLISALRGLQIFSYQTQGRPVCNPKIPNLRPGLLKRDIIDMSTDCLALVNPARPCEILLLDPSTGNPLGDPITHSLEICFVSLDASNRSGPSMLIFVDKNRDLFITQIYGTVREKLCTMTDTCSWHEDAGVLAAISDGKLIVWYAPEAAFVDSDLLALTKTSTEAVSFGKIPRFVSFEGSICTVRREDGALLAGSILPFPAMLRRYAARNQWDRCAKLCRIARDDVLWAVLAVISLEAQQLDHAEVALATIQQMEKLEYVQMIKAIPSAEGRNAEFMVYKRQIKRAEQILLQGKLIYRCIRMHIRLFNWQRALELAMEHKTHIDTVLGYRQNYLKAISQSEADPKFSSLASQISVNWDTIRAKCADEIQKEAQKGSPYRGSNLGISTEQLESALTAQ